MPVSRGVFVGVDVVVATGPLQVAVLVADAMMMISEPAGKTPSVVTCTCSALTVRLLPSGGGPGLDRGAAPPAPTSRPAGQHPGRASRGSPARCGSGPGGT